MPDRERRRREVKRVISLLLITVMLFMTGCTNKLSNEKVEEEKDTTTNEMEYYTAEDYLTDSSLFKPVWEEDRGKVPAEMMDFEEKWTSFFTPNGRTMSVVHRGDHVYYPENSVEAFLSCIYSGADIVEVDVKITKDGIPVVMHDDTLTRTTNVQEMRNKVPGLPESDAVSDWTLAQLRRLRLRMETTGEVTNYIIPTLEEVIMICNERVFITLDHTHMFDWHENILPLIKKHNAWRTVMLPYAYTYELTYDRVNDLMGEIMEASGYQSALMTRAHETAHLEKASKAIDEYGFPKVIRCGEYNGSEYEIYKPYFDKYRIHIECLEEINDTRNIWKRIDNEGYNMIVTNDCIGLTSYIQEVYFQ